MPTKRFSLLLKQERERRGWSQKYVANVLQTTRVTISRWELGTASPSLYFRGSLCELFGKSIEEFFPVDGIDPLARHSPTELAAAKTGTNAADPTQASMMTDDSIIYTEHHSELTGSKEHRVIHTTQEDAYNDNQIGQYMSTDEEIRLLDAEKHRLEIQEKRLEIQRKHIEYTIEIADQMINMLDPACNTAIRSLAIEQLLTALQSTHDETEQEIPLPTFQSVRKALQAARLTTIQTELSQKKQHTPLQKALLRASEAEIPTLKTGSLMPDSLTELDDVSEMSYLAASSNGQNGAITTSSIGANTRSDPSNPYGRSTAILNPQEFVGRSQLVRRLYAAIADGQSISLVGPRRIGKSSVLQYLCTTEAQQRFRYEEDLRKYIFVLKDLGEFLQRSSEDFFNALSTEITSKSKDYLTLDTSGNIGAVGFSELLEQINDQGFHVVLLLDEFDKITQNLQFDPAFFAFLRAQANRGKVSYVTASRTPLHEVSLNSIQGSPFFNIFSTCMLEALADEEARELISTVAQRAGLPFTETEIAWVLKQAGRHPFFIQRVCYFLFEEKLLHVDGEIDENRVNYQAYTDLQPHFNNMWERLPEAQRAFLQDEAQQKRDQYRELPELSESALFRQFVRDICQAGVFHMTSEELEKALDKIDDTRALGETNLRFMKAVSEGISKRNEMPSVVERGIVIREVLKEAFERLRGSGTRSDSDPNWRSYNILYYRYFKYHLKNEQVASRLGFSLRQCYRYRKQAIEELSAVLVKMEASANSKDYE